MYLETHSYMFYRIKIEGRKDTSEEWHTAACLKQFFGLRVLEMDVVLWWLRVIWETQSWLDN